MTARLRSMVIDGERSILVYDRAGLLSPEQAGQMTGHLQSAAVRLGLAGALVFVDSVELGDAEETTGGGLYADEIEALAWAIGAAGQREHGVALKGLLNRMVSQ